MALKLISQFYTPVILMMHVLCYLWNVLNCRHVVTTVTTVKFA